MTIPVSPVTNTQTFGAWLSVTNRLANIVSQNTVTADSSTGGSVTTGNSFVNGHFGAEFVYVANTLIGGNVSSNGVLRIQANLAVTNGTSNVLAVTANATTTEVKITSNSATVTLSGNLIVTGNTLVVNTGNVLFTHANVQFSNSPLTGNITFGSNATFTGTAVIVANDSFGTNGSVLYSNGTGMYWNQIPAVVGNSGIIANADGIFVNANNGLLANSSGVYVVANNGLLANSTGVFVVANNGITANITGIFVTQGTGTVVNSTGVHVNSAYIATIAANSATGSLTNAFTVGTASFFVANGNLGVGNSAPAHRLRVEGDVSLSGGVHANGSLGTAGQVLHSNGTVAYWDTDDQGVTSIASGNGLTGGTITTTGTISVLANNGITANATGLYVTAGTGVTVNATGVHIGQQVTTTSNVQFGSLGIGTAPSGVTGEIRVTNNITAYYSDLRLKTNIETIPDALNKVAQIRGVTFINNSEAAKYGYTKTHTQVGVIAQEVAQVLPEIVVPAPFDIGQHSDGTEYSLSGENYKTVQYDKLVPLLIEAIKELKQELDLLKGKGN